MMQTKDTEERNLNHHMQEKCCHSASDSLLKSAGFESQSLMSSLIGLL